LANHDPIAITIEFGHMDGAMHADHRWVVGDIHDYVLDAPPRPTVYVICSSGPRGDHLNMFE